MIAGVSSRDGYRFYPADAGVARVYHYTSISSLLAIIETGTLLATEATSMNDLGEIRHGMSVIGSELDRVVAAGGPHAHAAQMLRNFVPADHETIAEGIFALCASTDGDDANQWRLYGDRGHGVAIELDTRQELTLLSTGEPMPDHRSDDLQLDTDFFDTRLEDQVRVSPWQQVVYTAAAAGAVKDLVDYYAAALREWNEGPGLDASKQEQADHLFNHPQGMGSEEVGSLASLIKSDGFVGEREVRLIAARVSPGHVMFRTSRVGLVRSAALTPVVGGEGEEWSPSRAVSRPNMLSVAMREKAMREHRRRGVLRAPEAMEGKLPILSITLGYLAPRSNEHAIRALLNRYGYDTALPIGRSEVPLAPEI